MGHRQARDAFVYWCSLLFSPPLIALLPRLHPSIISSSLTLTAKLLPLLIMLHCDFSQGLSSLLFPLFICSVFETGVSGSRPLITTGMQLMCMSDRSGLQRPHGPAQYSWKLEMTCSVYLEWVLLHIFSLSPFGRKHIGAKDLFHLRKLPKCGQDYCSLLVPLLRLYHKSFPALFWSVLQIKSIQKSPESWVEDLKAQTATLQPHCVRPQLNCQSYSRKQKCTRLKFHWENPIQPSS